MSKIKVFIGVFVVLLSSTTFILTQQKDGYNPKVIALCANLKADSDTVDACYAKELIKLPLTKLTSEILALENQKIFKGKCHVVSHFVGRLIAKEYSVAETIDGNINYKICSQGIMHGYLEEIGNSTTTNNLVNIAAELCRIDEPSGCIHGVGHAFSFSKISISKTAEVCEELTPKLRVTEEGKKLKAFYFNINCIAGYVMQEALDHEKDFLDIKPEAFKTICKLSNADVTYGCYFAHYRQYSKMPYAVIEGRVDYFNSQPEDPVRMLKLEDFKKYCFDLPQEVSRECYKYFGMTIADIFNVERKAPHVSPILHQLCKEELLCYTGYFDIIISQILTGAPAYFKDFCKTELCETAMRLSSSNDIFVTSIK